MASYGFNPKEGYAKYLSPLTSLYPFPDVLIAPDGVYGVSAEVLLTDFNDVPNQTYRFDISDAQYASAVAYANEIDARAKAGTISYNFWNYSCVDFAWGMMQSAGIATAVQVGGADFAPGNNGGEVKSLYDQVFGLSEGIILSLPVRHTAFTVVEVTKQLTAMQLAKLISKVMQAMTH